MTADLNTCVFSEDRAYRYSLFHRWGELDDPVRCIMWIGLNPSTADERELDPTLRRIRGFSDSWGFNAFVMTNLFAFRATRPGDMKKALNPFGPLNLITLIEQAAASDEIVAAWGSHGSHMFGDTMAKTALREHDLHCLGTNADGSPKHPLYLAATTPLQLFRSKGEEC